MNPPVRPRRAALLCTHFTRNLAFYRAGWRDGRVAFPASELWATVNSNFIDIAVLEWCKLFVDGKAFHSYTRVVSDPAAFLPQLILDFGKSRKHWDSYLHEMRTYRNKFVAHLDKLSRMEIPDMDLAEFAVFYLYDSLLAEQGSNVFRNLPGNLRSYEETSFAAAVRMYESAG